MTTRWAACLALLAAGLFGSAPATAEVFKCRDAGGGISFSDLPCAEGAKDEGPPPIDSTPKSLGVDCWYRKNTAACDELKRSANGRPEVLAQAREDYKYAQDRDLCLQADYQACMRSICRKAFSNSATPSDIVACSREQRLPNGGNWAMVLPWKDSTDGVRKAQGFCLTPAVDTINGKSKFLYPVISFRDDPRQSNIGRYPRRYSVSNYSASTIAKAATRVCTR